ncbi:unnamed protein product [Camellia sinensis]
MNSRSRRRSRGSEEPSYQSQASQPALTKGWTVTHWAGDSASWWRFGSQRHWRSEPRHEQWARRMLGRPTPR